MMVVNAKTGKKEDYGTGDTIIELFKTGNEQKKSFQEQQNLKYKLFDKNIFNFY